VPEHDPVVVAMRPEVLGEFVEPAVESYKETVRVMATTPPDERSAHGGLFAVLLGAVSSSIAFVESVEFGRNSRASDPTALDEFKDSIVPKFGPAYEDPARGYWLDPGDLLRIHRLADDAGLDIIGSIHLHPDWHRIGPPAASRNPLSECPTPMDRHMFGNAGWPVNIICYFETLSGGIHYTLQAWGPQPGGATDLDCPPLATVIGVPNRGSKVSVG
jgi:hypothetical protein